MRNIFILAICLFLHNECFATIEQTYRGKYANGTAEYTYTDNNDLSRIFEGRFKYKEEDGKYVEGSFVNNLKNGIWKSNLLGVEEQVEYKSGVKHGAYKLKMSVNGIYINIDSHFNNGNIDTMIYISSNPNGTLIRGRILNNDHIEVWSSVNEDYSRNEFYYKGIFIGEIIKNNSTGDVNYDYANIIALRDILKANNNTKRFAINDTYYKITPVTRKSSDQTQIDYLRFQPLELINYYHAINWHPDLIRGEIIKDEYIVCYQIVEDTEYQKKINDFKTKFNASEYGIAIKYLQSLNLNNEDVFKQEKHKYLNNLISQLNVENTTKAEICSYHTQKMDSLYKNSSSYRIEQKRIEINDLSQKIVNTNNRKEKRSLQKQMDLANVEFQSMQTKSSNQDFRNSLLYKGTKFQVSTKLKQNKNAFSIPVDVPNGYDDIIVIPTNILVTPKEILVKKAIIFLFNKVIDELDSSDIIQLDAALKHGNINNKLFNPDSNTLLDFGYIKILRENDSYVFNYNGFNSNKKIPITPDVAQSKGIIYIEWENPDINEDDCISFSEVKMAISERFDNENVDNL